MASALMPEMLSILQDIYESEELKIDSVRSKTLKQTVDTLCVTENDSFRAMLHIQMPWINISIHRHIVIH